jgi:spore coat polysaccharide biosynthesis protein SpsF
MGQSDEHDLTLTAVKALSALGEDFAATIVVGPGADHRLDREVVQLAPKFTVVRTPNDLPRLMAQADLGLIGFGDAACELAALGVPAVYLCQNAEDAASASAFERAGMGISLGVASRIDGVLIGATVAELLTDSECLRAMSAAGRMNLDGRGAVRIAQHIRRLVDEREEALRIPDAQRQMRAI